MRDKLYEIFMDKLEDVGRLPAGGAGEISQKWEDYLSEMGVKTQNWAEAVHQSKKDDIVVRNPCESDKPYMLVPKDLALKILVLGRLP